MKKIITALATALLLLTGSIQPANAAILTIAWVSPASGVTVSGVVTLQASASTASSNKIISWCLTQNGAILPESPADSFASPGGNYDYSGSIFAEDYSSTTGCWTSYYSMVRGLLKFDTTTWTNGTYQYVITVRDDAGRSAISPTLSINTNNAAPTFSWNNPNSGTVTPGTLVIRGDVTPGAGGTAYISQWCLTENGQKLPADQSTSTFHPGTNTDDWGTIASSGTYDSASGCWNQYSSGYSLLHGSIEIDTLQLSKDSKTYKTTLSRVYSVRAKDTSSRSVVSPSLVVTATNGAVTLSVDANTSIPAYAPSITAGARTLTSIDFTISSGPTWSTSPTQYAVRYSRDGGDTWLSMTSSTANVQLPNLAAASAIYVQAAAVSGAGQSAWGPVTVLTTKGARPNRVIVTDSFGQPVSGGTIAWSMVNEATHSSKIYGLTAAGVIDFPSTPAGLVDITITNAELEDGTKVSGITRQFLGLPITKIQLPGHSPGRHKIFVHLPDSTVGVANVKVGVQTTDDTHWWDDDYRSLDAVETVGEFTFSVTGRTGWWERLTTNQFGEAEAIGFDHRGFRVSANYDDSVINQTKYATLATNDTDIELDYIPWFSFANSSLAGSVGSAVPVVINLNDAGSTPAMFRPASVGSGESVKLIPPAGAKTGACGKKGATAKLSGVANAQGVVNLKVCATVSGSYKIQSTGAAATGSVQVLVSGAPSLPVNSVVVGSKSIGSVSASWNAPTFTGGAPILDYKVVITNNGKTFTKTVKPSARAITLTGLANASDCTVKIQARNKYGYSDVYTDTVPIA